MAFSVGSADSRSATDLHREGLGDGEVLARAERIRVGELRHQHIALIEEARLGDPAEELHAPPVAPGVITLAGDGDTATGDGPVTRLGGPAVPVVLELLLGPHLGRHGCFPSTTMTT